MPGPADNALITSDGIYAVLLNIDTTKAALDLSGDVVAVGSNTTKMDTTLEGITNRFYRVQIVP